MSRSQYSSYLTMLTIQLELGTIACSVYITGAQEWHIVSLLGDVTSPTTVAHYASMTSHLRILSTEKHWQPGRQHTVYTNKRRTKYIVRHWTSREAFVQQWKGDWSVSPSIAWFAHPWFTSLTDALPVFDLLYNGCANHATVGKRFSPPSTNVM